MKIWNGTRRLTVRVVAGALVAVGLSAVAVETSAQPAAACEGYQGASAAYARSLPQVRHGQSGTYVLALQLDLRERGYHLTGTAYYGPNTLKAAKDFQRRHHIKASGIVGPRTWTALIGSKPLNSTWPAAVHHIPRFQVRPGDRSQSHLGELENVLMRVEPGAVYFKASDGAKRYNPALVKLVKEFQRKNGIKASGIVGPKTWTAYAEVISATAGWGC